jgi:hypothetical protein
MGEQLSATRWFIDQRRAQSCRINGDEQEVVLSSEMLRRRFSQLSCRRKMNISVG